MSDGAVLACHTLHLGAEVANKILGTTIYIINEFMMFMALQDLQLSDNLRIGLY